MNVLLEWGGAIHRRGCVAQGVDVECTDPPVLGKFHIGMRDPNVKHCFVSTQRLEVFLQRVPVAVMPQLPPEYLGGFQFGFDFHGREITARKEGL